MDGIFWMATPQAIRVSVWTIPHDQFALDYPFCLSVAETRRQRDMPTHRAHEFGVSRHCLRRLIGHRLRRDPSSIRIATPEGGKPFIPQNPIHFSLSHHRGFTAIAIAAHPVGVDIMQVHRQPHITTIAKRVFHPQDVDQLMRLDGQAQLSMFFKLWTRHEAVVKAMGVGLLYPVKFPLYHPVSIVDWCIGEFQFPKEWMVAVASQTRSLTVIHEDDNTITL